jgi:signal transduction histidine kinase
MIAERGIWNFVCGIFLVFLILAVPALVVYDILYQLNTPTMDFYLDDPESSTVQNVIIGGKSYDAGLETGDVILTVDDIQFKNWPAPQIGRTHVFTIERRGDQISLPIEAVRIISVNFPSLFSAIFVAAIYWSVGAFLFLRKFWNHEIRILYLFSQAVAITILFPLSFQSPWSPPDFGINVSRASLCFVAPLFLHFSVSYPIKFGRPGWRIVSLALIYGLAFLLFLSWMRHTFPDRSPVILYTSSIVACATVIILYVYQYRASLEGRRRTRIIILATIATVFLPLILYLIPKAAHSSMILPEWAAGLFLILAPVSYFFTTVHYNLFGIDRLVNRTLVYTVLSFGILIIYLLPFLFLYRFLPDDIYFQIIIIFSLTVWIGWTFTAMRTRAERLVDRFIYGSWYDYPAVIEVISDHLAHSDTRSQIIDVLTNQMQALMRLSNSNLWISDSQKKLPPLPSLKAAFRYQFQTEVPAQWTVDSHTDGDDLSESDQRILRTIAQQAEIALNHALAIEVLQNQLAEINASREVLAQTQRQLLRSREEERSRLARDLHDSPIQSLVGVNIQIGLLLNQKGNRKTQVQALTEMRSEIRQVSDDLRRVCADLRPPMLDSLGLSSALHSLASEWSAQSGTEVQLDLCPDADLKQLPGEVSVNYYRVAQEALANIKKHAKAQKVEFQLAWISGKLKMSIRDNGAGFDAPDTLHGLTSRSHFGLAGMKERINLIGGEWSINSETGKGTVVRVVWPADENAR